MKLHLVAVGHRMPGWVNAAYEEYARRMPPELPLTLTEVKAEPRSSGKVAESIMKAEAIRIEGALSPRCHRVVLDEHGTELTSTLLAQQLERWRSEGEDVAFIVGGPDGLAPSIKSSAHEAIRLSSLTLPHALVRQLLAEALYRAWTITRNHPYHRE